MRRPHILRPNHRSTTPSMAVWVDVETTAHATSPTEERHVLDFGMAAFRRRLTGMRWSSPDWIRFDTAREFWAWIAERTRARTRLYLYAHNAGYDLTVLEPWSSLHHLGWTLTKAIIDAPPFIAHWKSPAGAITAVDTLNVWKAPLAVLGKEIGIPKLPMPGPEGSPEEWTHYCRRDVEIIMEACLRWWDFLRSEDLGNAKQTIAAQAFTAFRHRYMRHEILIDDNRGAMELARHAYHGGRCECSVVGRVPGPLYLLDVRSHYPAVMRAHDYPVRTLGKHKGVGVATLADWLTRYSAIADVDVETDVPLYPYRDRSPLLFPTGSFRTTLTTPELIHAVERGHVTRIHMCAIYEHAPIFGPYVDAIYAMRERAIAAGDRVAAWTLKLLLNSLYGKFGQRGWRYRTVAETDDMSARVWNEFDADTRTLYKMRQFAGIVQEHWQEGETRDSFPAIAAHVTAYGRAHLWRLIERAGRDRVYYYDTDSLLVDGTGLYHLSQAQDHDGIGSLRLERTVALATLHTPKDYELDGEHHTKGIRRSAQWIDPRTVLQERWLSVRSLLYRGDLSAPVVRRQKIHLARRYRKGVVLPGGRVRPYRLPEEAGLWDDDGTNGAAG